MGEEGRRRAGRRPGGGGGRLPGWAWAGRGPRPTGPGQQWPVVEGGCRNAAGGVGRWGGGGGGGGRGAGPGGSRSLLPVQVARISRRAAAPAAPVARRAGGEDGAGHGLLEAPGETVRSPVSGRAGQGGTVLPGARAAGGSMKKNPTVQGTFSKLFGKKHANPPATSLYATNPPWIFTQEAPEEGTRDFGECAWEPEGAGPPCGPPTPGGDPRPGGLGTRQRGGEGTRLNLCAGRAEAWGKGGVSGKGRAGPSPQPGRRPLRAPASDPNPSEVCIFSPRWKLCLCLCQKGRPRFAVPSPQKYSLRLRTWEQSPAPAPLFLLPLGPQTQFSAPGFSWPRVTGPEGAASRVSTHLALPWEAPGKVLRSHG